MRVSPVAPAPVISLEGVRDPDMRAALQGTIRQIIRVMDGLRKDIALVDHRYISQNSQPTPEEGELLIWKDADATTGQPQAYIVTKQDGAVYTFASDQTVP